MKDELERLRIRTAERQKTLRRLGIKFACCVECGETDPICFEKDHVDGQKHSEAMRTLCVCCHRKRTKRQQTEHPPVGPDPRNVFEVGARFLLSEADYHDATGERKRQLADMLLRLAKRGITDDQE